MQKKRIFLAGMILSAALALFACKLPASIELESDELKISTPVRIASFNPAEVLSQAFRDSFPEGFEIFDMVHDNYKDTQTFLVAYEMELIPSFNPSEYLGDIEQQMDDINDIGPGTIDPINPDPIIVEMEPSHIESENYWFDMSELFEDMESQINTNSTPETIIPFPAVPITTTPSNLPTNFINLPPFMALTEDGKTNFESVIVVDSSVSNSRIELSLSLGPAGFVDNDINIKLTGIALRGESSGDPIGKPQNQEAVLNKDNNFSKIVTVDLAEETIIRNDPPKFSIGGIEIQSTGASKTVSFDLIVQPQIRGIALRGATGLKIGAMNPDMPQSIVEAITLGDMPPELLNALVSKGSLTIESELPPREGQYQTYCEGMTIEYDLAIAQAPTLFDNKEFPGLASSASPLEVRGGGADLEGKYISREPIQVINSKMTIRTGSTGANFELFDGDIYDEGSEGTGAYRDKSLPIMMNMGMEINELSLVRWKRNSESGGEIIPTPDVPDIDFGDMDGTDLSEFVTSITFEKIALDVDFTTTDGKAGLPEALEKRISLEVKCADLGLDETKPLVNGSNTFSGTPEEPLKLKEADGTTPKKLKIDVALIPVVDGISNPDSPYMEFGPLVLDESGITQLDIYGEVGINFNWIESLIDLNKAVEASASDTGQLNGIYPASGEQAIDLSAMNKYLSGFSFQSDGIKARIYISGPNKLINLIEPSLRIDSHSSGEKESLVPLTKLSMLEVGKLPSLSNAETPFAYSGDNFPENDNGGIDIGTTPFTTLLAGFPQDLRFAYEVVMPQEFIVKPDTFDNAEDQPGAVSALVALIIPLELQGGEGAYFSAPEDVFYVNGKPQDLFGRTSINEPVFGDIRIKSAGVTLDFEEALFKNAYLHIDDTLFPDGINLNNGQDNNLTLSLDNKDWEIIHNNLIYPAVKVVYPQGSTVRIPRKIIPTRITVSGGFGYTIGISGNE